MTENINNNEIKSEELSGEIKFCFSFFGREHNCEKNDDCKFSHDKEEYKKKFSLKECPIAGCQNYCKTTSNQCSSCLTSVLEQRRQENKDKFCFSYFGYNKRCENGEKCVFSHDREAYKKAKKLKDCPKCDAFCMESSSQCSTCTASQKAAKKAEIESREDRLCKGIDCPNMTKFTLCKTCWASTRKQD